MTYPGRWAALAPHRPAVIHSVSGETRTYKELDDRSNQLARLFRDRGLERGDHVAAFLDNRIETFDVIWAALRSGLYLTLVNRYLTAEEAGYIVDNCEARLLVSSGALADVAKDVGTHAPGCEHRLAIGGAIDGHEDFEAAIAAYPAEPLERQPLGAFMLYSSGTTGRPKGIHRPLPETDVTEDAGAVGALQQLLWGFDENTVYLSPAPLYHSAPAGFCTAVQALGGTVVMMPKFDPAQALESIERFRVTHSQWVPTMFSRMLKLPEGERNRYDLSSLKVAIHAAAPCPRPVKQQMLDWWGDVIYEYYAGTELNGFTHVTAPGLAREAGHRGPGILNGTIHICDDDGEELPVGKEGIVYFEQEAMPFEYYNDDGEDRAPPSIRSTPTGAPWGTWATWTRTASCSSRTGSHVHDHLRRREHLSAGNRGRADRPPEGGRRGGHRRTGPGVRRGGQGGGPARRGRGSVPGARGGAAGLRPGAHRPLQVPALHRLPGRTAPPAHGQALQASAQGPVLGSARHPDRVAPDRSAGGTDRPARRALAGRCYMQCHAGSPTR
jgi:long-chain acyl-CoA synthetase